MRHLAATKVSLGAIEKELAAESGQTFAELSETLASTPSHDPPNDDERVNPWTEYGGNVIKFLELPCMDKGFQTARLEEHRSLVRALNALKNDAEEEKLAEITTEKWRATNIVTSLSRSAKYLSSNERFHIRKIMDEYASVETQKWELCIGRIKMELRHLKREDIDLHTRLLTASARLATQHAAHRTSLYAQLDRFIGETPAAYMSADLAERRADIAETEAAYRQEDIAKSHAQVAEWRNRQAEAQQAIAEETRRYEDISEKQRLAAEAKAQVLRLAHAEAIECYQQEKHEQVLKQIASSVELQEAFTDKVVKRQKHNQERILHRDAIFAEKMQIKTEEAEQQRLDWIASQERLAKLCSTVAPDVHVDRERATADTEAFKAFRLAEKEPAPFYRVDGYTSNHVLKDRRMKLSLALHEKGLTGNSYARDMLRSMVVAPTRPDQITAIKFG
ncbi:hypothetical protein HKX48_004460 [Thoreauomyces humboldtii]|nr:hypothetical protein HKX48_004460 [Thoreauomyces humboldtii]